jgi:hypothetical protein
MRERFDAVRERSRTLWHDATPLKRGLMAGIPVVIIALAAIGGIYAAVGGGDGDTGDDKQAVVPTATQTPTATKDVAAILRYIAALATPTPGVNAGLQDGGSAPAGGSRGGGGGAVRRANPSGLTGPGPITGTDMRISIPALNVSATIYGRTVGTNGQMGNPAGAWDVIWYDFSQNWQGLGGRPEEPGANVVLAGHVDYIRVGPAVFWGLRNLGPGQIVTVSTSQGTFNYSIQWSAWAGPTEDFSGYVKKQDTNTITLVTCIGGFSGGHYSNRLIVRGVRV